MSRSPLLVALFLASSLLAVLPTFAAAQDSVPLPPGLPVDPRNIPMPKMPKDLPPPPPPDATCEQFCDYTETTCKAMCKEKKIPNCETGCLRLNAECKSKCEESKKGG